MRVSLREIRMVFERLVQVARVPDGMVASVRDCGLYSAALGLGGFDRLQDNLDLVKSPDLSVLVLKDRTILDAGGLHAWLVAELAVDLAVASIRSGNAARIQICNVQQPAELAVAAGFAVRHGFAAEVDNHAHDGAILLREATTFEAALLDRIRQDGLPVAADLWWRLYHASAAALAPDTVKSRRHAGPVIVAEDGKVIGRQDDDETDFSLLTSGAAVRETNPVA